MSLVSPVYKSTGKFCWDVSIGRKDRKKKANKEWTKLSKKRANGGNIDCPLPATKEKQRFAARLRSKMTPSEHLLWSHLKVHFGKKKFRAQIVVLGWIADFYCHDTKIVVEVDGNIHLDPVRQVEDRHRDAVMHSKGFTVLRFTADEITSNVSSVVSRIKREMGVRTERTSPVSRIANGPLDRIVGPKQESPVQSNAGTQQKADDVCKR